MKNPSSYGTNTTTPAGRANGQFNNNPGDGSGSGMVAEADNDNIYAAIAVIESYKEGGISDSDETTTASDMRDAIEELTAKKVDGISDWAVGSSYATGALVMRFGYQFVSYLVAANIGNDPLLNPDKWYKIPNPDVLLDAYFSGKPFSGGLSDLSDRAGTNYQQNIAFGNFRMGGNGETFYDFFRVALDGTQVTGDATLEAILDPGGANEYWNIDVIAPDVLGTRTLIDMGGRYIRSQSGASDVVPAMGTTHDDAMQRITGEFKVLDDDAASGFYAKIGETSGVFTTAAETANFLNYASTTSGTRPSTAIFDNQDSIVPNVSKTDDIETKVRSLVVGCSYVVIMIPA